MLLRRLAVLALPLTALALASACSADAPPVAERVETPLAFTDAAPLIVAEVEEVHEDADGRVWIALYQRPGLLRATFGDTTHVDTLGALGSQPGQFRMPFAIMDAPAKGVFALDGVARRLVGFAEDGSPDSVLDVPMPLDPFLVRHDTTGGWVSALGDQAKQDSVPLVRLYGGTLDTIARVHVPKATVTIPLGERTYVAPPEYAARDIWGLLPNGTVWIARGGAHQVDYRLPDGSWTVGGPAAYATVRSTDADRGVMRGLPAAAGIPVEAVQYAPVKGPFIEARAAADGEVWTWRTQAAPKSEERYTVFRPGVAESHDVVLPLYHRVVGLGMHSVYVAERLEDGRWRVTRHPR